MAVCLCLSAAESRLWAVGLPRKCDAEICLGRQQQSSSAEARAPSATRHARLTSSSRTATTMLSMTFFFYTGVSTRTSPHRAMLTRGTLTHTQTRTHTRTHGHTQEQSTRPPPKGHELARPRHQIISRPLCAAAGCSSTFALPHWLQGSRR